MSGLQHKTYGTARFHIPEGLYSIEEIEDMLRKFKDMRAIQSAHLAKSMGIPEKK